ncbi:VOC family protein [Dyella tabacisoli]|uniref:Glyoxalase n=1 Tax=Dyella tabacisoli TaxID=2282381 RepID=A0A369ULB3_9GAMM|nr:VOC family protein [Dyella tabacisoli]RDD81366.1 glyoxalase [Dyella tabacisoli]
MTEAVIVPTAECDAALDSPPAEAAVTNPFRRIDHIALAVVDLEGAMHMFENVLGFELKRRLTVEGKHSGMISAEFESNGIRFVLCQGTEPESQVAQLVKHFGVGVAHIALEVDDVDDTVQSLKQRGLSFDTTVIRGPGLTQAFSSRCINTGLSFEVINRNGEEGFLESNVQQLFDQLEQSGKY